MPGYIDIQVYGDASGVLAMLIHLEEKLVPSGMTMFLTMAVEPYLTERAKHRFDNEGDDVVGMWAPLRPATEAIRAQKGYGAAHPINRRTGELENYIVNSGGSIKVDPVATTLTLPGGKATGELAEKVETAQIGKGVPNTPARPVLGMNFTDLEAIMIMMGNFMGGGQP